MNTNLFSEAHSLQFSQTEFNIVHGNQTTTIHNHITAPPATESGLLRLYEVISEVGALHDDDARFPPPKCHPNTRKAILNELTIWAGPFSASDQSVWNKIPFVRTAIAFVRSLTSSDQSTHHDDNTWSSNEIYWLYGPAGVGKSAIAQTLCERLHGKNLAASFFFSRNSPTRDNAKYLFLTIAYCLATYSNDSELRSEIDNAVKKHPGVLKSSIVTQFHKLVVDPLRSLPRWKKQGLSRLVIIDGLDECMDVDAQRLVLETITESAGVIRPLRFLITSRPEHAIQEIFNRQPLVSRTKRMVLDDNADATRDIRLYLHGGFRDIRKANSDISFPSKWPEAGVLDELVTRASGQFIYASTVLKYVGDRNSYPPDRLQVVFNLPIGDAGVFADLDILYHSILASNPQGSLLVQVLALVLLTSSRSNLEILEQVFSLPKEAIALTLRGLHSVLKVSSDSVNVYHKSFADFLLDKRRSREYFIDLDAHRGLLLDHLNEIFAIPIQEPDIGSQSTSLNRATMIDRVNHCDRLVDALDDCFRVLLERFNDTVNFLLILGTFLCLRSIGKKAVSIALLEDLLSGSGAVSDILQSLGYYVLESKGTEIDIRLSSFEDFLLDSKRSHKFFIDLSLFHTRPASYCLKVVHNILSCEEGPGIDLMKMNPSQLYAMNHVLEHLRHATMADNLIYQAESFDVVKYLNWKLPRVTVIDSRSESMHAERQLSAWAKALHANINSLLTCFQVKKWGGARTSSHQNTHLLPQNLADGIYIAAISDVDTLLDLERLLTYQVPPSEEKISPGDHLFGSGRPFNYKQLSKLVGVVSSIVLIHPDEIVTNRLEDFPNQSTTIPRLQAHFIDFRRGHASWAVVCMEKIMARKSQYLITDRYAETNCLLHVVEASRTREMISKLNELLVFLRRWAGIDPTIGLDVEQPQQLIDWLKGFPEAFQSEIDHAICLLQKLSLLTSASDCENSEMASYMTEKKRRIMSIYEQLVNSNLDPQTHDTTVSS